ncbi:hypothetical protein D3C81_1443280 [compost metagenome]
MRHPHSAGAHIGAQPMATAQGRFQQWRGKVVQRRNRAKQLVQLLLTDLLLAQGTMKGMQLIARGAAQPGRQALGDQGINGICRDQF